MLKIKQFAFNFFEENTYLVWDDATGEAVAIDPGMLFDKERDAFDREVEHLGLTLKLVLQTHLHLDHCFGSNHVAKSFGVPIAAHEADAVFGTTIADQCARFGIKMAMEPVQITRPLSAGDHIALGECTLQVLHVPGHSPGGLAFYCPQAGVVFSGDSLFRRSIGRTDLLGGSLDELLQSIQQQLFTLPESTIVYSGHGPSTTIGEELRLNPFL